MIGDRIKFKEKLKIIFVHFFSIQLNGSVRPIPPPRDHLHMEKDGRLVNRAPAPQVPDRKTNHIQNSQIAQILDPTSEQLDSIKKYQVSFRFLNLFYFHYEIVQKKYQSRRLIQIHKIVLYVRHIY